MRTNAIVAALFLVLGTHVRAAAPIVIEVKPGPTVMSADERAIVADATKGAEHGVILIDETDSNDDKGSMSEIAVHVRAKILSPEGRGLADIVIPIQRGDSVLRSWWGRTILPDGRVIELPESELKTQSVQKSVLGEYQELKGALPGVVPGCVIDYGYVLRHEGFYSSKRVVLQREWPVRNFRYRWVPHRTLAAAYAVSRAEGRAVDVKYDEKTVLVTARELDPVPEEPHMPPLGEARASVTFYYSTGDQAGEYWDRAAKGIDGELKRFLGNNAAVHDALSAMAIPSGAPLHDKLRLAYDWLGAHVKNTRLMSAEEEEAAGNSDNEAYNAKTVLKAREASPNQLDFLFAVMARALGADARIARAADRTDRFWNKAFKSMGQFNYTFVAVRAPGEPDESLVFVDAGSGLPYGQVPWRATGATALLCGPKGSSSTVIPPASPAVNRADTTATLSFSADNETLLANWNRTASGATGLEFRRWLRDLDARQRRETLDALCGASGSTEVTAGELPGLDEASAPFQISCTLEQSETNIGDDLAWYSLPVTGPWFPDTPLFVSLTRVHPVIFDYPRVDIVGIDITAPHGFKPKDPPPMISLETRYGRYQLAFTKTPTGIHVDRAYALTVLLVKPDEYDALRKFFDEVRKADRTTIVFERDAGAK